MNLTLKGWEKYYDANRGKLAFRQVFLARQFDAGDLDDIVKEYIRPTVKEFGYELLDMLDVSETGIIDNIMRERIRISAFVIADLSHENTGVYWEGGYAEDLGKKVIYTCEKKANRHFDIRNCQTCFWHQDDAEKNKAFQKYLKSTINNLLAEIGD